LRRQILAEDKNFTLPHRILLLTSSFGILFCLIGASIAFFLTSVKLAVVLGILVACLWAFMYYFVRFKGIYKIFIYPIIFVSFLSIEALWIFGEGLNAHNIIVGIVALILTSLLVPENRKIFIFIIFILLVAIAYYLQFNYPGFTKPHKTGIIGLTDSIITTIYASAFLMVIIDFLQKHYKIEKNRAEENAKKFRILFEQAAVGVAQIDTVTGKFVEINNKYSDIIGYTIDEIYSIDFKSITHPDDVQTDVSYLDSLKAGIVDEYMREKRYIHKDGHIVWVELFVSPMWEKGKKPDYHIAVASDITSRKLAELTIKSQNIELLKLNTDKDRFISILAHDLKSPFHAIMGFLNLLKINVRNYYIDKIEYQINLINNSAQSTYKLLDDILLWARAQSGKMSFEPQSIPFDEVLNEIISGLIEHASSKGLTIQRSVSEKTVLKADLNMLKLILRNLISNAIKFTGENGEIRIFTEIQQEFVIITVSDNGIGIEKEDQDKLWNISEQFVNPGTAGEMGTGLGLLLCKEFVNKHGCSIWVESEPGKGSSFKFTMPLAPKF